jgi:diguanylate cyclase (GGDEF)-like protein
MQYAIETKPGDSFESDNDFLDEVGSVTGAMAELSLARRRADRIAARPSLQVLDDQAFAKEPPVRSLFANWMGWLLGKGESEPEDIRIALAAPLLEHSSSLLTAHAGLAVLALIATVVTQQRWAFWFCLSNIAMLLLRIVHLNYVRRLRARFGSGVVLRAMIGYWALGIPWAASGGLFVAFSNADPANSALHAISLAVALGICSGIAARCAGVPAYALTQIGCWILPQAVQNLGMGPWNVLIALAMFAYLIAMISIVRRLRTDMLALICLRRRSDALASRFDAALSNMSQGLVLFDALGSLRVVNRSLYRMFGLAAGTLVEGDGMGDLARACLSAGLAEEHDASIFTLGQHPGATPARVIEMKDGRSISVSFSGLADGGTIATFEDITERRANEARIAHMAMHDALTDLPNRLLFRDRLDQFVARLGRREVFAVACLDLDHFKAVNDTLGHNMGDELLKEVATRLSCCVREVDLVARLGGDEFAVLLPGVAEASEACIVAKRLIETISGLYEIGGASMTIGVSIGVALAPRDGADAEALLMHADLAMYAAKADGRGGVRMFEHDLSTRLAERQDLERDFRAALEGEEFVLHYQPIVDVARGRIAAFEALVRWQHPRRGLVPPDQFIPFAEESGLVVPLGEWVLDTACSQAAAWPEKVSVAVNLSPVQFRDPGLLDAIMGALSRSGLAPARLELEITEASVLGASEATLATLRHLRSLGVKIAFDDFGTGFSSLSYLHRFSFDKLKIDKSFIGDLGVSESADAIVRAVTGLGANLNLVTTAEGVETAAQLAQLRALGCGQVQGYLFSRPRPNADVPMLLANDAILAPLARVPA